MKIFLYLLIIILIASPALANNSLIELSELEATEEIPEENTTVITGNLENPFGPLSMIVLIMALVFFWIIYKDKE